MLLLFAMFYKLENWNTNMLNDLGQRQGTRAPSDYWKITALLLIKPYWEWGQKGSAEAKGTEKALT